MHIPVLQKEVLKYLEPEEGENFIDCTLGQGGHSLAILERVSPKGKVLAIDWDPVMTEKMQARENLIVVCDNFSNIEEIAKQYNFSPDGILFDLGFSSIHLEESKRGFSFQKNEKLDMRYNPEENDLTAAKIINEFSQKEIEKILKEYGEERFARKIAKQIVKERPIETTFQLVEVIKKATPSSYQKQKIHFATRTFQALRIATNNELENFQKALSQSLNILNKKGRVVIISFHSLEDRIVKKFFKGQAKEGLLNILTQKPIVPSEEEIKMNPRSRSAKLRAAIKIKKHD